MNIAVVLCAKFSNEQLRQEKAVLNVGFVGVSDEQPISRIRRSKAALVLLACLLWHACNTILRNSMQHIYFAHWT